MYTQNEKVTPVSVTEEMQRAYIDCYPPPHLIRKWFRIASRNRKIRTADSGC